MKTFRMVTFISLVLNLTAASLAWISSLLVGFYPAIIGLSVMACIPIASRLYLKSRNSVVPKGNYRMLIFINVCSILIVLWMSFVNTIDHVIPNLL